eukprot:TRINITY_DN10912_c0_g1_i4.p1 TRINITY_DN10912_c0_g1~~TRINITY_DN10912_c0_g1_i4.p1  ORF type:complete len:189 (+),score=31.04 TRINITY_DN10912_c0_g1_i4:188-754(+)
MVFTELISALKEIIEACECESMMKLSLLIVKSIAAEGETVHIECIIENKIPELICRLLLNHTASLRLKNILVHTFTTICEGASEEQIEHIVNAGGLEAVLSILKVTDTELIMTSLLGLEEILVAGEARESEDGINEHAIKLDSLRGLKTLEDLSLHANSKVSKKAQGILSEYFYFQDCEYNRANADCA